MVPDTTGDWIIAVVLFLAIAWVPIAIYNGITDDYDSHGV